MSEQLFPSRVELEVDQIRAEIALKRAQAGSEPWKVIATVIGALAAGFTGIGVLIGYLLRGSMH